MIGSWLSQVSPSPWMRRKRRNEWNSIRENQHDEIGFLQVQEREGEEGEKKVWVDFFTFSVNGKFAPFAIDSCVDERVDVDVDG